MCRGEEEQDGSENGSEDTEGCRKDPNFVRILLSGSVDSELVCEKARPHAPAIGGRQWCCPSSHTEDMVPTRQGSKRGIFYTTADGKERKR